MNAQITAESASISPFSHVRFRNPESGDDRFGATHDGAGSGRRYSLMKIIAENMVVHDVELRRPRSIIVEEPMARSNLDPLTKGKGEKEKKEAKPSKPPKTRCEKFVAEQRDLSPRKFKGSGRDFSEFEPERYAQKSSECQSGKLQMGANVAVTTIRQHRARMHVPGEANGNSDFALKDDLRPSSVKGGTTWLERGRSFAELAGLSANLAADLSPSEIKKCATIQKSGERCSGEIRAKGRSIQIEAGRKIQVAILSLDRQVLNLLGGVQRLDFG